MTHHKPKIQRNETKSECNEWGATKSHYLKHGLCQRGAAQAAYGHQHGFSQIEPPCEECRAVASRFPVEKLSQDWRSKPYRDGRTGFSIASKPSRARGDREDRTRAQMATVAA